MRQCGLPFRQAHGIVSALVRHALENNLTAYELSSEMLRAIAKAEFGLDVELDSAAIQRALDPRAFVEARDLPGGAAPAATAEVLELLSAGITRDRQWLDSVHSRLVDARKQLDQETREIMDL